MARIVGKETQIKDDRQSTFLSIGLGSGFVRVGPNFRSILVRGNLACKNIALRAEDICLSALQAVPCCSGPLKNFTVGKFAAIDTALHGIGPYTSQSVRYVIL